MAGKSDRRKLLTSAALTGLAGGPAVADEALASPRAQAGGTRRADYVIVGAGYSGMTAAYRLKQAGASVIVVEANDRVGGRTWSTTLSDGSFVDIGGGWTGSTQTTIMSLVKDLGLKLRNQNMVGDSLFVDTDGSVKRHTGLNFPIDEAELAEVQTLVITLNLMAAEIPLTAHWNAPQAKDWDLISAGVFVRQLVTSPRALAISLGNIATLLAHDPHAISLLHLLFMVRSAGGIEYFGVIPGGSEEFRIQGGLQQIPLRIASRLGRQAVILNSPVRQINQSANGVEVVSERAVVRAKRAIVAIPSCLQGFIRFDPLLPANRALLTQHLPHGSVFKAHLIYDRAFWRDEGLSGDTFAIGDALIGQTLDAGPPAGTVQPGILACFAVDDASRKLEAMSPAERKQHLVAEMVARFGPKAGQLSKKVRPNYVEHMWAREEWARGDFAGYPGPTIMTSQGMGPALRTPFRRVHWAGVDTATRWYGSIDGAAMAGERAAAEVLLAER